jgi:hypothetical protein
MLKLITDSVFRVLKNAQEIQLKVQGYGSLHFYTFVFILREIMWLLLWVYFDLSQYFVSYIVKIYWCFCLILFATCFSSNMDQFFSRISRPRTFRPNVWLETGKWFSPGTPVSSTNKTDRYDGVEHHSPNHISSYFLALYTFNSRINNIFAGRNRVHV